ncbi:MAG: hypothetical protein JWN34_1746 [Bryobacterales bacterium]|nr:hypothetical protein [Bryobacterales bacterium]
MINKRYSRRELVSQLSGGLGALGLAGMFAEQGLAAPPVTKPAPAAAPVKFPNFKPKAKHNIVLFMVGGPSQMDMFDPKPALLKYQGQRPSSVDLRTERVTGGLLPSPFEFKQYGRGGVHVSSLLPNIASVIDEICVIKSMYTFNPTHTPARSLFHTGNIAATRPSMGSWLSYGLGSENKDLPGFVVLSPGQGGSGGLGRSGFLPARHQGTYFDDAVVEPDKMIRFLKNADLDKEKQRTQLDLIQALNKDHQASFGEDEFLEGRIESMETAYSMQFEATDAFDIRKETQAMRDSYGDTPFAHGCLLARRLVERGVRTVHVYYGPGQPWDDHSKIEKNLKERCPDMDKACAALISDLKQRGLLDETLITWGGEFGRTPVSESGDGRDHNPYGFTMWMAGGGVKGGMAYGETDEFGFKSVEKSVSIHDLHATMLNQMGIDHLKLTYRYAGRDFRLTDVFGEVVRDILT